MMIPSDPGWISACARAYRASRDARWWLRLTARNAVTDAVDREASRLAAEAAELAAASPVNGTLQRSLSRGRP